MITSALKSQTSVCCSIALNPYMVFQTWNHEEKKKRKKKAILLLAYIADVSSSWYWTYKVGFRNSLSAPRLPCTKLSSGLSKNLAALPVI